MNTADIDPTTPPAETRCAAHLFQPNKQPSFGALGPLSSGSPLRIPNTPEWPPTILFDVVYASAVIRHFGTQTLVDEIAASWEDSFDPGGIMVAARIDYKVLADERAANAKRRMNHAQARHDARSGPDMTLPYILVPRRAERRVQRDRSAE